MEENASSDSTLARSIATGIKKTIALAVPFSFLQGVFLGHPKLGFFFGIIVGAIVQHFVPPKGRKLWPVVCIAAAGGLMRVFFT
jgi:hypothetical protein